MITKKLKQHGRKAEDKLAARIGGRCTPGSGTIDGAKGDVRLPGFLVESKSTINDSLGVKLSWLRKISMEAAAQNRLPALAVQFVDAHGHPVHLGKWVLVPETTFQELLPET